MIVWKYKLHGEDSSEEKKEKNKGIIWKLVKWKILEAFSRVVGGKIELSECVTLLGPISHTQPVVLNDQTWHVAKRLRVEVVRSDYVCHYIM